jgi:hypothetical protein
MRNAEKKTVPLLEIKGMYGNGSKWDRALEEMR